MSKALEDVAAERQRQITEEGWATQHDDKHRHGELANAAGCYAIGTLDCYQRFWPWYSEWWKPTDRRRNLVKAGALILAEIERLDRAAAKEAGG